MYAKLIDGVLQIAPSKIKQGTATIFNPTEAQLLTAGYLPVVETDAPEVDEYHYAEPHYTEQSGQIVQSWTVEELPAEELIVSDIDRIEAQVMYTALMTDTLLDDEEEEE